MAYQPSWMRSFLNKITAWQCHSNGRQLGRTGNGRRLARIVGRPARLDFEIAKFLRTFCPYLAGRSRVARELGLFPGHFVTIRIPHRLYFRKSRQEEGATPPDQVCELGTAPERRQGTVHALRACSALSRRVSRKSATLLSSAAQLL